MPSNVSLDATEFDGILQRVAEKILCGPNIQEWENFMQENDRAFAGRLQNNGEFSLDTRETHEQFVSLVENNLESALVDIGYSADEFMTLCANADAHATRDSAVQAFLELILGCTDFMIFGDIMSDVNKRAYYFQMINMWKRSLLPNAHK